MWGPKTLYIHMPEQEEKTKLEKLDFAPQILINQQGLGKGANQALIKRQAAQMTPGSAQPVHHPLSPAPPPSLHRF